VRVYNLQYGEQCLLVPTFAGESPAEAAKAAMAVECARCPPLSAAAAFAFAFAAAAFAAAFSRSETPSSAAAAAAAAGMV